VLKVDVEAAEWPFLRNAVSDDLHQLDSVRQLAIELHTPRFRHQRLSKEDTVEMIFYAKALSALGFTVFRKTQRNVCCKVFAAMMPPGIHEKCCQEVYYVKR